MMREMRPATMIAVMFLLMVLIAPAFCLRVEPPERLPPLDIVPEAPPLPAGFEQPQRAPTPPEAPPADDAAGEPEEVEPVKPADDGAEGAGDETQ